MLACHDQVFIKTKQGQSFPVRTKCLLIGIQKIIININHILGPPIKFQVFFFCRRTYS